MNHLELSVLAAAREEPRRTALVVDGREIAYDALAADVERAIGWLDKRLAPGDTGATRVALVADQRYETLVTLYALFELGRPAVLLHPRWTAGEQRRFLDRCAPVVELERPWPDDDASMPHGSTATLAAIDDERALAVVATSGTGGEPKGAVLSRRAMLASAHASASNLGWQGDDRWLLSLPVAHVGGLSILTRCLAARRTAVSESDARFDAEAVARIIEERRVTLLSLVPTTLRRLLDLASWRPPAHLRAILLGGAAASPALLDAAAERGLPVLATYGLTEACSQVTCQPYATVGRALEGCGPPLPRFELDVDVADEDGDGGDSGDGAGAIRVRGDALFSGYLPAAGDAHLDTSPFDPDGFLRTGDRGRLDAAGHLHVLGRLDQVIISGGENVDPLEVERALEEHPAIAEACVFATDDDRWGQAVVAALVTAGQPPAGDDLRRHCAARLAPFKRPRRIVYLDVLPRTAGGKIARAATAERARNRLRPL